jgi:short-subunit dehydrogenase
MLGDLYDLRDHIGESAYAPYFRRFANKAPRQVRKVVKPEKVAGVVIKALQKKSPKSYYMVNNNPVLRIAQLLPQGVRDHFMQRMIK